MRRPLIVGTALALILALLVSRYATQLPPADLSLFDAEHGAGRWHALINVEHNAFHQWRSDPLLMRLQSLFSGENELAGMPARALQVSILFLGITTFLLSISASLVAICVALTLPVALLYFFGADSVVLGSLTWSGWFMWSVRGAFLTTRRKGLWTLFVLAFACRIALSANQLALLVGPFLVWLGITSLTEINGPRRLFLRLLFLIAFAPALLVLFNAPAPQFPTYPQSARVVPASGVPGLVRPYSSAHASLPVVNRSAIRQDYALPALTLVGALLLVALGSSQLRPSVAPGLLCATLVALDAALPEALAQIAPLASVSRLIPGYFLIPLSPLVFALGMIASFVAAALTVEGGSKLAGSILMIGVISAVFYSDPPPRRAVDGYLPTRVQQQSYLQLHPQLVSPSLYVARHFAFQDRVRPLPVNLPLFDFQISAWPNPESAKLMHDGSRETRWATSSAQQRGNEWLRLDFAQPVRLAGIVLDVGGYTTDFPRGVSVTVSDKCTTSGAPLEAPVTAYHQPSWQGPLRFTESGYAYFGGEHEVELIFDKPHELRCLVVQQTGKEAHFDWTVAELSVLGAE